MLKATFNKGILITDPCYLIKESEWNFEEGSEDYVAQISTMLSKTGFSHSLVAETGCGDWINFVSIGGLPPKGKLHLFAADAGMVCVVPLDEYIELLKCKKVRSAVFGCAAVLADFAGEVEIDTSNKDLTVVAGQGNYSFSSVPNGKNGEEDV
jgi:hypothetical protein